MLGHQDALLVSWRRLFEALVSIMVVTCFFDFIQDFSLFVIVKLGVAITLKDRNVDHHMALLMIQIYSKGPQIVHHELYFIAMHDKEESWFERVHCFYQVCQHSIIAELLKVESKLSKWFFYHLLIQLVWLDMTLLVGIYFSCSSVKPLVINALTIKTCDLYFDILTATVYLRLIDVIFIPSANNPFQELTHIGFFKPIQRVFGKILLCCLNLIINLFLMSISE